MIQVLRTCLVLLFLVLAGCGRGGNKVIGVVPKGANHIFWKTVQAGAIKAAQEKGYEIEWNAPTLEIDASRQIEIVESMINRKLAGIVLAPIDRKALVGVVERAAGQKIPVSIFDSALDSQKIVSYVATDNLDAGKKAAMRMGEILASKGKVAVIGFMPGSASTMEREEGFQSQIQRLFPKIEIVGVQFGMADRAKAMAATENFLTAHPDLAGVFADNESSSVGAAQALKSRGAKQVKMVAFDSSEQLIADLRAGWIDTLVVQNPFKMGYEATRAVLMSLDGKTPVPVQDSGSRLIVAKDLEKPGVKALLFPKIEEYLSPKKK